MLKTGLWHETLVFLVELMFAEQPPDWLDDLLFCLFGEDFSEVISRKDVPASGEEEGDAQPDPKLNQAILLAQLAINPHAGLTERGLKLDAITHCCAFEAGEQKRNEKGTKHAIQRRETVAL